MRAVIRVGASLAAADVLGGCGSATQRASTISAPRHLSTPGTQPAAPDPTTTTVTPPTFKSSDQVGDALSRGMDKGSLAPILTGRDSSGTWKVYLMEGTVGGSVVVCSAIKVLEPLPPGVDLHQAPGSPMGGPGGLECSGRRDPTVASISVLTDAFGVAFAYGTTQVRNRHSSPPRCGTWRGRATRLRPSQCL